MTAVPLPAEDFDIERYRNLPIHEMMVAIRRDLEFKMPPRGLVVEQTGFDGEVWQRATFRCPKDGCWYVVSSRDVGNVKWLMDWHLRGGGATVSGALEVCPVPPRREILPSGSGEIEKLWRELDDAVAALKSKSEYRDMSGDALTGFAKGLAFCIVMKDKEFYPTIRTVAAEAERRWKMHNGLAPWVPTKTDHRILADTSVKNPGNRAGITAARKSAPKKALPALSAGKVNQIKTAKATGMFDDPADIALMCNVTVEQVKAVLGGAQ